MLLVILIIVVIYLLYTSSGQLNGKVEHLDGDPDDNSNDENPVSKRVKLLTDVDFSDIKFGDSDEPVKTEEPVKKSVSDMDKYNPENELSYNQSLSQVSDSNNVRLNIKKVLEGNENLPIDEELVKQYADIRTLHQKMGCSGDNKLANRMKFGGLKEKEAINARARMTANTFKYLFEEELEEQSNKIWWENTNGYFSEDALLSKAESN